jgi:iron complex outermembrane receptor protein
MKINKLLFTILFFPLIVLSNIKDTTINIQNVTISRKRIEEVSGFKKERIDDEILKQNSISDLSQIITENTPIHVKTYGQNGISTVSFRGTNATHTEVNWNGISINSITLGQFDFALIPAFFIDNIDINYGAGTLKNSSGAFGGSIDLSLSPNWDNSYNNKYAVSYGSENSYSAFARDIYRTKNFLNKFRIFIQHSDNDFYYENKWASMDVIKGHRKHNGYTNMGILNESYYKFSSSNILNLNIWIQNNYRDLPKPFVVENPRLEEMSNTNIRTSLNHKILFDKLSINTTASYLFEKMDFDSYFPGDTVENNVSNNNKSNSIIFKTEATYKANDNLSFNIGIDNRYDFLYSDSYGGKVDRNKLSTFLSSELKLSEIIKFSALIREDILDKEFTELVYSLGTDIRLLNNKNLFLKLNLAKNIKRPSMNDLYYVPTGNKDLVPEHGINYETSLIYEDEISNKIKYETSLSAYYMDVTDWIIWKATKNRGYWGPDNYKKVISKGIEYHINIDYHLNNIKNSINSYYSYCLSTNKSKSDNSNDNSYNKQLIYIPKHKFNISYSLTYKNANLSYNLYYVGDRYTDPANDEIATDYLIHDANISYKFNLFNKQNKLQLKLDNIFNTLYFSVKYYPMPMRQVQLVYSISM